MANLPFSIAVDTAETWSDSAVDIAKWRLNCVFDAAKSLLTIVLQNVELQNVELQNAENTKRRITKRR